MSSSEELKKARTYTKGHFTRLKNSVTRAVEEETSARTIEDRYKQFMEVWTEVQQRHESYVISSGSTEEDVWIEKVLKSFEKTQSNVDDYLERLLSRENIVKREDSKSGDSSKLFELRAEQEEMRFNTICSELKLLLSSDATDAEFSVAAVTEFIKKLELSKATLDDLLNKSLDLRNLEKEFVTLYSKAKVFSC